MSTYEKYVCNFPEMNTSKIIELKLVQNEYFQKKGGGGMPSFTPEKDDVAS
jgi:hypothetical protein